MRNLIRKWLGVEDGLCVQMRAAAEELARTAKELRSSVAVHEKAPDPFASLLGTMWNNREVRKFPQGSVDIGKVRVYRRAPSN